MRSLSFFSGAMGLDLGLEHTGIHTIFACEADPVARRIIAVNRPDIPVTDDIWNLDVATIRARAGLGAGEDIDVVAGGPPCQAFSTVGVRRGLDDVRGNVFLRYVDLIGRLQPRYAVIENVRGLLSMPVPAAMAQQFFARTGLDCAHEHGVIQMVTFLLREAGYTVRFHLYNAANYGTPQIRERVILVASREGGAVPYLSPTHSDDPNDGLPPWVRLRDAFATVSEDACHAMSFPESMLRFYRMLGPGENWRDLPEKARVEAVGTPSPNGGHTGLYRRLSWDRPSPTLTTSPTRPMVAMCHPSEDRPLSVEEYKAIQQFPLRWRIEGNLRQQYRQIGNAVPVGLGEAIGRAILAHAHGRVSTPPPVGFAFSRYAATSDAELAPDCFLL